MRISSLDFDIGPENVIAAVNDAGLAVAIWHELQDDNTVSIMTSFLPLNGVWTTPFPLQTGVNRFREDTPDIQIDPKGNVIATWKNTPITSGTVWAAYFDANNQTWSAPALLDAGADQIDLPKAGIDADGNAIVVWNRRNGILEEVVAVYFAQGSGFEAPIIVDSTNTGDISNAHVVMDIFGNATAAWTKREGMDSQILSATLPLGGVWSSPVLVSTEGTNNRIRVGLNQRPLSVDQQGTVRVIWDNDGTLQSAAKLLNGDWQLPEDIFTPENGTFTHNIGGGTCGFAVALWGELTSGPLNVNTIQAALNFGPLAPLNVSDELHVICNNMPENPTCQPLFQCCRNAEICDDLCQRFCGDGFLDTDGSDGYFEICDDGNRENGDGCSDRCLDECGDGIVDLDNSDGYSEPCDDGNLLIFDGCTPNCEITGCGDGFVNANEQCDDGNLLNGDDCSSMCQLTATTSTGMPIPINDLSSFTDTRTNIPVPVNCQDGGPITDIHVAFDITHTFGGDLVITAIYDGGMPLSLVLNEQGLSGVNGVYTFHDPYPEFAPPPFNSAIPGLYLPFEPLNVFLGQPGTTTWSLSVEDVVAVDTGELREWSIFIQCDPPSS